MNVVYRVQDSYGNGPYGASGSGISSQDWADDNDPSHMSKPCPQEDGIPLNQVSSRYHCGFESMDALENWFSPTELGRLKDLGFFIYEITVPEAECIFGDSQLMFNKQEVQIEVPI